MVENFQASFIFILPVGFQTNEILTPPGVMYPTSAEVKNQAANKANFSENKVKYKKKSLCGHFTKLQTHFIYILMTTELKQSNLAPYFESLFYWI